MVTQKTGGQFFGRARIARKSENGGARHVFAHIKGMKNDLVWAPWGGILQNPFPGAAKLYAADPMFIEYDDKCENPKLYCLKTYEVAAAVSNAKTITLIRDGYHHIPFVGDCLMVAPATLGGKGKITNVTAVTAKTDTSGNKIWELATDTALTIDKGAILVEGVALETADTDGNTGEMLVKNVNAFLPCDYDFVFENVADPTDDDDFENADYALTPVAGVLAYTHRMSVMPKCVLDLNQSKWNGIFGFNALP